MNLPNSHNATSSPGSDSGPMHFGLPGGPIIDRSGREAAPASLSARQAKAMGLLTSGTFGRTGTGLSTSADLSRSLANRLRRKTDLVGSILYRLTWKDRVTPLGQTICALRASAHHMSASDLLLPLVGWNTPRATDGSNGGPSQTGGALSADAALSGWPTPTTRDHKDGAADGTAPVNALLGRAVWLAGWPTPMAGTPAQNGNNAAGNSDYSCKVVELSGWATPNATFQDGDPAKHLARKIAAGVSKNPVITDLSMQAKALAGPMRVTTHGEILTGFSAATINSGQLNPEHSRWLMGIPAVWGFCALTATLSSRKSLRRSSKPRRK